MTSLEAGVAANQRLASIEPGNAGRQDPVWASHGVIGDVLLDQGRLADALAHYVAAQGIAERRVKADPASRP